MGVQICRCCSDRIEYISYAVCQYFGIETAENSFGYIASWSQGKELKELRASLETINRTSSELISGIEKHFQEICKERGIDLTAEKKELAQSANREETEALYLVNDSIYLHVQQTDDGWDFTLFDKNTIHDYANTALSAIPGSPDAYYWLIYAMTHLGMREIAKNELRAAKQVLIDNDYEDLVARLKENIPH